MQNNAITAPTPDGVKSTATGGSVMDPFSWPIEEFDQPTTSLHMVCIICRMFFLKYSAWKEVVILIFRRY